jgi:uncharacterized membrane protein
MEKLEREEIHLISQHSNWSPKGIQSRLDSDVYASKPEWGKFLSALFIALGVGFFVAGVLFFFAYNWVVLHKSVKLGIVEFLLITTVLIGTLSNLTALTKNIILTGSAVLVGVLFAVFGQIYQTGANAYDFFWGWTLAILLWVVIVDFSALWLVFAVLVNTTFSLYIEQVAHNMDFQLIALLGFLLNLFLFFFPHFIRSIKKTVALPFWYGNTITMAVVILATVGIISGFYNNITPSFYILILLTAALYFFVTLYSLKFHDAYYIIVFSLSLIAIITALLFKISDTESVMIGVAFFSMISTTWVIKKVLDLKKQWNDAEH